MITLNAYEMPKNVENEDYSILSVRYIVSTDSTYTDDTKELYNVLKPATDSNMLSFSFDHTFSVDVPVYGKVIYNYPNGLLEESSVCRCTPNQSGFSFNNNIIANPVISIRGQDNYNQIPYTGFIIDSSDMSMFMGHGEHLSTSYYIYDTNNKEIFASIKDDFNLTYINIDGNLLEQDKSYRIEVIHHNNYDTDSNATVLHLTTSGTYSQFNVDVDSLSIFDKSISSFSYYQSIPGFKEVQVDVSDSAGNILIKGFVSVNATVKIPASGLVSGSKYIFTARAIYTNSDGLLESSNKVSISGICRSYTATDNYNQDLNYLNKFTLIHSEFSDDFINNNNLLKGVSREFANGDIPIYKIVDTHTIEIRFYKYYGNKLVNTGRGTTITTTSDIVPAEGVNIFLLEDEVESDSKLIVMYIANVSGVVNTEIRSAFYIDGKFGNIDPTRIPTKLQLPFKSLISHGVPIIDYKSNSFLMASVPLDNANKQTIHSVKKDLSSYSSVIPLLSSSAVINNSISMFPLSRNRVLKINTDYIPTTYGIFDTNTEIFELKGQIPSELQNMAEDPNLNKFYGFTRIDGKVLLMPNVYTPSKFALYLVDIDNNKWDEAISNSEIGLPSKYIVDDKIEISKMFAIELISGSCLFLMSGDSAVFEKFTDIWEYN